MAKTNFGQGKSTAVLDLFERLNLGGVYTALFITANEINRRLHNALGIYKRFMD